jgi:hypothetical protein
MNKIMFNDKYGLTDAVLQGRKTMTRRAVQEKYLRIYEDMSRLGRPVHPLEEWLLRKAAAYKVGEVIAVAQSYKYLGYTKGWVKQHIRPNPNANCNDPFEKKYPGQSNKMFVPAELNKAHQIRITDIKVERLQDISDEDCFKEGIIPITWRQHLPQGLNDLSPQKYIDHNVYTLEKFREGIEDCWAESDPNEYMAEEANVAFAVLIFKMLGRKVWEQNPYVFAYTFELVK